MAGAKLTALRVRQLVTPGRYGDGGGLYLQVRDAAHRSWLFRYTRAGRAHEMGLGPLADVSLAEARDLAQQCRKLLRQGVDPLAERRERRRAVAAAADAMTFSAVAARYIATHEAAWKNAKHRAQWTATLETYAYPVFGAHSVAAVATGDVTRALEPIWTTKRETARRLRGRIETILDFATTQGWRAGENPARWRGHLEHALPKRGQVARVRHHAALPWRDIGGFMRRLAAETSVGAVALQFTILTATRTGETLGARWGEIDRAARVWTVPAERMKAGVAHRVPLTDAALAVLDAMALLGEEAVAPVFPGHRRGRTLSNMAMTMVLRRIGRADLTVHGFRSTFRDWVAETTDHPGEVAEAALAHTIGSKVEAAYRRGDLFEKRRRMMEDWAAFCLAAEGTKAAGDHNGPP